MYRRSAITAFKRSLLSLGAEFGLSESRTSTLIRETEGLLLKDRRFHLKGKKALLMDDSPDDEPVIIDVSESPVERPKKAKALLFRQEKAAHP